MLFPYMHIHICSFYRWIKVCWYTLLGFFLCCLLFFFRNNGPHCLYWGSFCVYFPWVIASLIINFPVWWIACKESSPEWHINYVSNGTLRGRPGNRWQHQLRDDSNRRAIMTNWDMRFVVVMMLYAALVGYSELMILNFACFYPDSYSYWCLKMVFLFTYHLWL